MVEAAAALVPTLQWPLNCNIEQAQRRLMDTFWGCFNGDEVRPGMDFRATSCLKASGVLQMVTGWDHNSTSLTMQQQFSLTANGNTELTAMIRFFHIHRLDYLNARKITTPITQWSLRFISAQSQSPAYLLGTVLKHFHPNKTSLGDKSLFADFLLCVNSFFMSLATLDHSVFDKR
jgi:hypothetical protein